MGWENFGSKGDYKGFLKGQLVALSEIRDQTALDSATSE